MNCATSLLLVITTAGLYRGYRGGVLELIFSARPVVKIVLLILLMFSVVSWAIIFFKFKTLRKAESETREFLKSFVSKRELSAIYQESRKFRFSPVFEMFRAGYIELKQAKVSGNLSSEYFDIKDLPDSGLIGKVERTIRQAYTNQITRLERNLSFLATTGNSAPFIGLFGTVWGIMEAFHDIGQKGTTSLAIVAPGISEALIATAVGLFAAIPAVIAYNYFLSRIRRIVSDMDNFTAEFLSLFER